MTELEIRTADPAAASIRPLLAALDAHLAGLYPPASNHGLSIAAMQAANVHFVVAERDGKAVGCGALRLDESYAEIKRLYVVPEARGEGIGHCLLAHLEELAATSGRLLVRLETGVAQPEALALFERAGFSRIAPFPPYRPDPFSVFMEKAVVPLEESLGRAGSFP
jgi:putative acetyltransferase